MTRPMRKVFVTAAAVIALIIIALACAENTEAATKSYPYDYITKTNGHFRSEERYTSGVLLECAKFPGKYWTMRSDGWLTLAKLAKDPVAAGQVFSFRREETVATPGEKYGSHLEHNQWHLVYTSTTPIKWLTQRTDGFFFDTLDYKSGTSVLNLPEQQWRLKLIRTEGDHQVIRVVCRTGLSAAAAGHGECIPHEYIP